MSLLDEVRTQSALSDSVIVAYSGGKDSAVVLDLCCRFFSRVEVFFMHYVQALSFQDEIISYAEDRYGVDVIRLPHFELGELYRNGLYRRPDPTVKKLHCNDVYTHVRRMTGIHWIAGGERISDSLWRRAMLKNTGSISENKGRFYPIASWTKADVLKYISDNKIRISPEYRTLGHSFRGLNGKDLSLIKRHYPQDYAKIMAAFPMCDAAVFRYEAYERQD